MIEFIARSLELLKKIEGTEQAQGQLHVALGYATKLYAFGTGGEWKSDDSGLVIERGMAGLEELDIAYGVLPETARRDWRSASELYSAIEELLAGPASPGRAQLHELLRTHRRRDVLKHLTRFGELLEQVTQGELMWPEFVDAATREIAAARRAEEE
ncbi:MAG: hypothetical protein JNK82_10020 [Myxococcaceae bacterium]|nr:hypothetical protein [Myxococcaceae bacterium]